MYRRSCRIDRIKGTHTSQDMLHNPFLVDGEIEGFSEPDVRECRRRPLHIGGEIDLIRIFPLKAHLSPHSVRLLHFPAYSGNIPFAGFEHGDLGTLLRDDKEGEIFVIAAPRTASVCPPPPA